MAGGVPPPDPQSLQTLDLSHGPCPNSSVGKKAPRPLPAQGGLGMGAVRAQIPAV